jgi:hypothetical protein
MGEKVNTGSMILKLQNKNINKGEANHDVLLFGEFINHLTPYSNNNAYLFLGSLIANKKYSNSL